MSARDNDPFLYRGKGGELRAPRLETMKAEFGHPDGRGGVPAHKFGAYCMPIRTEDKRQAVMMMLYPPEELRDQPLNVVRAVIANSAASLLETIALEIYKAFTSDPIDATGAQNVADALAAHAKSLRTG